LHCNKISVYIIIKKLKKSSANIRHRQIKKKNKSCLTNLLEFLEKVGGHIDNGQPVDVIFLNFQKAFDKVPHRRLI